MPNDNDLIERYLYAITRHLPSAQRSDVAEELRTLISDMLDERCGSLPPTAKDVRVVLTELGTPGEMVRKYTSGEGECLIGQPYYAQYLYVLKIVLACVAGGMLVAGALSLATGAEGSLLGGVLEGIGSLIGALLFAFAIVTLLFAFFSRRGIEVVFWLTNFQLVDSHAVVQAMQSSGKALEGPVLWAVSNAQTAFCGLVVAALVIDAVDSIVKTVRAR